MKKPTFDPGLTQKFTGVLRRSINKDGSFNVQRRGGSWRHLHPYLTLLNMNWTEFFLLVFAAYCVMNFTFRHRVLRAGSEAALTGVEATTPGGRFLVAIFFLQRAYVDHGRIREYLSRKRRRKRSEHHRSTGRIAKRGARHGAAVRTVFASFGAYRFQREGADRAVRRIIQPARSSAFWNQRPNVLMEVQAHMILMTVEGPIGAQNRKYQELKLERDSVYFLALSWTIVHPIDEESPLFGKTPEELRRLQAEFVIMIKAFDDTFAQIRCHARYLVSLRRDHLAGSLPASLRNRRRWEYGAERGPGFELRGDRGNGGKRLTISDALKGRDNSRPGRSGGPRHVARQFVNHAG